ncbi:hypothetical protein [Streptomyces dysideae]|uniref:Uncharacterized protein n=1 Tax=Streptomyces dysideae TaxID=909626 RepID=A0A117S1C6_9ACTN|nr:hypothetical protein [Streptomyces dysideae]KUO20987.1 hypothetical protein AQJ91_11785 [Streptomyces dysideae]
MHYGGRVTSRPVIVCLPIAGIAASVLVGHSGLDTVVGCGIAADGYPSQTAEEWIRYADHVVVASPVQERETNRREFTQGQFRYETDRTVTFRTDSLLWSAARPRRSLGKGFDMTAPGWQVYRESGTRVESTTASAPRLETGHTYLLAVRWSDELSPADRLPSLVATPPAPADHPHSRSTGAGTAGRPGAAAVRPPRT